MAKTGKSPQEVAQRKLAHAIKQVEAQKAALKRAAAALARWDRRVAYYARLAARTEEERMAEKAAKAARAATRPKRRGIELTSGVGGG